MFKKYTIIFLFYLTFMNVATAQEPYEGLKEWEISKDQRMKWFREARFGMFIHWGLYAGAGGVWEGKTYPDRHYTEWLQNTARIPSNLYAQVLKPKFTASKFDASYWAKLAKNAGMKYVIITSRHHEGFTIFNSKEPYSLNNSVTGGTNISPAGRDLYGELSTAFHNAGLKVGAYYSLLDWQNPDSYDGFVFNKNVDNYKPNHEVYKEYIHNQIMELAKNYNELAVLWPDFSSKSLYGESWGTKRILEDLLKVNPNIIVSNRFWNGIENKFGDFGTPEKYVPPTGLPGMDWEVSHTMNESYGYSSYDKNWKSYDKMMRLFIETVSKGGNFLLNIGPDAEGQIPQEGVAMLEEIGDWMSKNSASIYGTTASPFASLDWGYCTRKGDKLYFVVFDVPASGRLDIPLLSKVKKAYLLDGSKKLNVKSTSDGKLVHLPKKIVGKQPVVVVLELSGDLKVSATKLSVQNDGNIILSANTASLSSGLTLIGGTTSDPNRPNAIGNWNPSGEVYWNVKIQRPGDYKVLVTYKTTKASNGQISVDVDGNTLDYLFAEKEKSDFKEVEIGTIHISQKSLASASLNIRLKVKALNQGIPEIASIKFIPVN